MAPRPPIDTSDCFNVLLTGFGPFASAKESNPSWEAVKLLASRSRDFDMPEDDNVSSRSNAQRRQKRRVHLDISFMPTVYAAVIERLPVFHGRIRASSLKPEELGRIDQFDPAKKYDFYLHVGQGRPGGVKLEMRAHRHGYKKEDVQGQLPPSVFFDSEGTSQLGYYLPEDIDLTADDCLETSLDGKALAERLSQAHPDVPISTSNDAGRYLCDYIYFASLAETALAMRRSPERVEHAKVLFVHISPLDEPMSLEQMADVLRSLIEAVCDSA